MPVGMYATAMRSTRWSRTWAATRSTTKTAEAARATGSPIRTRSLRSSTGSRICQGQNLLLNYGSDGTNTLSGFTQQQIGMDISSSAVARNVIDSRDFEVDIAMLPVPEGTDAQGVYAGGGARAWRPASTEKKTEAGVMEFLQVRDLRRCAGRMGRRHRLLPDLQRRLTRRNRCSQPTRNTRSSRFRPISS